MKYSRSKMYARRAQHKRTKTVTKVEAKKAAAVVTKTVKGDKNGGSRKVTNKKSPANKIVDKNSADYIYRRIMAGIFLQNLKYVRI